MESITLAVVGFGLAFLFHSLARPMPREFVSDMIAMMGLSMLGVSVFLVSSYVGHDLILHTPKGESSTTVDLFSCGLGIIVLVTSFFLNFGNLKGKGKKKEELK